MRTIREQQRGLELVQELVPGSMIVQHMGESKMLALRHGEREVVYVVGGYDGWTARDGWTAMDGPDPADMTVTEAAAFLATGWVSA